MKQFFILLMLLFSVTVLKAQTASETQVAELINDLKTRISEIDKEDFDAKTYLQLEQVVLDLKKYEDILSPSDDVLLSNAKTLLYKRNEAYKSETSAFSASFYRPTELRTLLVQYLKNIIDKKTLDQMTIDDLIENAEYKMNKPKYSNTKETVILKVNLFPHYVEKVNTNVREKNNVMRGLFEADIMKGIFLLSYVFDNLESVQADMDMIFYYTDKLSKIIDLSATQGDPMYRIAKRHYEKDILDLKTKFEGIRAVK